MRVGGGRGNFPCAPHPLSLVHEAPLAHCDRRSTDPFIYNIEPPPPTGFNITRRYHDALQTTVTFEWDLPPMQEGLEGCAINYSISITPAPVSHPATSVVSSPSWNVTLAHNVPYSVNLTAINCIGASNTTVLPGIIEISKYDVL